MMMAYGTSPSKYVIFIENDSSLQRLLPVQFILFSTKFKSFLTSNNKEE